jgi:PadR family transcriptional regulator, regulatory protein PadR
MRQKSALNLPGLLPLRREAGRAVCYTSNWALKQAANQHFDDRDLYSGLIRLHILHHAIEGPVFGLGMSEELARHGYRISPGTLYPLLHGLERKGYLSSTEHRDGKSRRKLYRATPRGQRALDDAKLKVRELFGELIEGK